MNRCDGGEVEVDEEEVEEEDMLHQDRKRRRSGWTYQLEFG